MFDKVAERSKFTEERLASLYEAEGFGGETTMRARVIRELIHEIRVLRAEASASPLGRPHPLRAEGAMTLGVETGPA